MRDARSIAKAQMMVYMNRCYFGEETELLVQKIGNPELFCHLTGCYKPRKKAPSDSRFPQSRHCVEHAKITKANAVYFRRKI
jgi:hypothetical protein